jgi:hypothetical protein
MKILINSHTGGVEKYLLSESEFHENLDKFPYRRRGKIFIE